MSDTLASLIRIFAPEDYTPQRFCDWIYEKEEKKPETAEQVFSRFDKLRRK